MLFEPADIKDQKAKILVIGVGGGGKCIKQNDR